MDGEDYYVVAAVLLPLNVHASTVAERLVEEALAILGSGAIKILLFDRGFLGGPFFDFLEKRKIDFICPTKDDQHLTRHMQGLHRSGEEVKTTLPDETILSGYDHLIKMESCQRKIETNGNRELKQGWYLNNLPARSWNGISAHIFFTLFIMFNVIAAYRSSQGRALTERGIISLRQKHFKPFPHQEVITAIADGYTATYSLGEFAGIFDLPPPSGKHHNYRWGRLPDDRRALFAPRESLLGK